ncbi:MAG TPA: hypothetical protein VFK06_05595 [Candidatus Angelobacter sp.]|nr:hypothetical protein [Candidatus Angelobacter sp.]
MNRRNLLKGMLALPVVGALSSCYRDHKASHDGDNPRQRFTTLRIILAGGFAVVLQKNNSYRVRAFIPVDPHSMHQFYFQDRKDGRSQEKSYYFELLQDGLEISRRRPHIAKGFRDFDRETDLWCQENNFVVLDLPAPDRIRFTPPRLNVTFANPQPGGKTTGLMPTNHILEYKVAQPDRVRLLCQEFNDECAPIIENGVGKFYVGVGLPPGGDPGNKHAVDFFNFLIASSFPHLLPELKLASIGVPELPGQNDTDQDQDESPTPVRPRSTNMPAVPQLNTVAFRRTLPMPYLRESAYTVDCRVGGVIVTTP